jgi:hypothetical protein
MQNRNTQRPSEEHGVFPNPAGSLETTDPNQAARTTALTEIDKMREELHRLKAKFGELETKQNHALNVFEEVERTLTSELRSARSDLCRIREAMLIIGEGLPSAERSKIRNLLAAFG